MDVSVLIPTINEATLIGSALRHVADAFPGCEVIVVDGGSSDGTRAVANGHAIVLESVASRGSSLNDAARIARGDVLLFLHADTMLPPDADAEIARVLSDPSVVGGAFRFSFDDASTTARVIAAWVNVRSTLFNVFLGDQALFVRKSVFLGAGGFRDWNLMEDLEILHRLRRFGSLRMTRSAIVTSARRHLRDGWLITTARVWLVTWLHFFHVSPRVLLALYRRPSGRSR